MKGTLLKASLIVIIGLTSPCVLFSQELSNSVSAEPITSQFAIPFKFEHFKVGEIAPDVEFSAINYSADQARLSSFIGKSVIQISPSSGSLEPIL